MQRFTWRESYGIATTHAPKIQVVRFGDGYEQRAPAGINTQLKSWSLGFELYDESTVRNISLFLESHGGYLPFLWNPPDRTDLVRVVCRNWKHTHDSFNRASLTTTFDEVRL